MTHDYFSKPIGRIPKKKLMTDAEIDAAHATIAHRHSWDRDAEKRRKDRKEASDLRVRELRKGFMHRGANQDRELMALGLSARQCDYLGRLIEEHDTINDMGGSAWKVQAQRAAIMLLQHGEDFATLLVHAERGTLQRHAEKVCAVSGGVFGSPTAISVTYDPRKFSKVDGSPLPAEEWKPITLEINVSEDVRAKAIARLSLEMTRVVGSIFPAHNVATHAVAHTLRLDRGKAHPDCGFTPEGEGGGYALRDIWRHKDGSRWRVKRRRINWGSTGEIDLIPLHEKPVAAWAGPDTTEVIIDAKGQRHDGKHLLNPKDNSSTHPFVNQLWINAAREVYRVVSISMDIDGRYTASLQKMATGGTVATGKRYRVGDASPELFVPGAGPLRADELRAVLDDEDEDDDLD